MVLLLSYRMLQTYLVACGFKKNRYMENVILGKTTTQFPDTSGDYGIKPSGSDVVIFMLGAKINQYVSCSLVAALLRDDSH